MSDIRKDIEKIKSALCCLQNQSVDPCCPATNESLDTIELNLQQVTTQDCNNNPAIRVVMECSSTPDTETSILCDVGGDKILVEISYINGVRQPIVYWNINTNSSYTGNPATDLISCPNVELESDPKPVCVTATSETILAHYVKENGEPTGLVYWTNIDGTVIAAPALGTYTFGACSLQYDKVINGEVTALANGGNFTTNFGGNSVSDIMVTNLTNGFVNILYTPLFATSGNNSMICASGQTIHINSNDINSLIQDATVFDLSSVGGGNVIINATRL